MNLLNEKIRRTQVTLKVLLDNTNTPDDVIRSFSQDLSRLRQQRDGMALEWILILRRNQEPEDCGRP
ncbi:hypothetical protein [Anthocerotibacter panamensis]|uniref:hypothetical protein n=1 Tax=Anthocerotibacter panamensis TaxID=2857077 RepID=UPI001C408A27|nr:hypothetical protein [Anthocerotibacter panamensis]